jgi:tetratricopeptide (TPR) repeat protein
VRDRGFLIAAVLALAAVILVYSNHFRNEFHFDDFHAITNNPYIRDLGNVPRFFIDSRTFSTLPDHQSYRPLLTTSFALDYRLGQGLNPLYFHISTFVWYLIQLALMYAVFLLVLNGAAGASPQNRWFALFGAALYGLHPVSAETVNYIVQRAEILSTCGVLAGLLLYIRFPKLRRTGLYLVPVVLGILAKTPAAVFAGILFTYILLFEEEWNIGRALLRSLPALVVCTLAAWFTIHMDASSFFPGGTNPALYRMTQPYVAWHYFRSFFWPSDLSADSDLGLVSGWLDPKALFGFLFVAALGVVACWTSRVRNTRPIALGLVWFLLALGPTAWVPLSEAANDHRMFFPFVGLTLAVLWAVRLAAGQDLRSLAVAGTIVLAVSAYAARQRNEVWRTEETLWRDVTLKSPRNGRGHMNYGLTQMAKGDYNAAMREFDQALPLTPNYSLLHINIAIAKAALGQEAEAAEHFQQAIVLAPNDSQSYFYYARWLYERRRFTQAILLLEAALRKNPEDTVTRDYLLRAYSEQGQWANLDRLVAESLQKAPNDPAVLRYRAAGGDRKAQLTQAQTAAEAKPTPEGLLGLSLVYYQAGRFEDCIRAARDALRLNGSYAEAYNNIAAAYNAMGKYDEGIEAAREAVRLKPDFELARNNLAWAQSQKAALKRP